MKFIKNINELAQKAQQKSVVILLGFVGILVCAGWFFVPEKPKKTDDVNKQVVKMDGSTDAQFSQDATLKALEEQQREIRELREQLQEMVGQAKNSQKDASDSGDLDNDSYREMVQILQSRVQELENKITKNYRDGFRQDSIGDNGLANINADIVVTNFLYADNQKGLGSFPDIKTPKNYIPAGTFARAVLLSGADTNAGVNGQTDTTPIVMRILDNGTLPNGQQSSLKGCFVTAAAYGDASSERGQIRLQRLSCVRKKDGSILDVAVEGTVNDLGGNDGIRGHVVMRNNKLIWNAGVSGILSGVGSAMQQSLTTQSVSPLGATNSIKSGKFFQYGAYGGANTALGKLADYYIKLADMYHPIVQVHAGSEVNVVFLKGVLLTEGELVSMPYLAKENPSNNNITQSDQSNPDETKSRAEQQNVMNTIKYSRLGQGVNSEDSNVDGEER